MEAGQAGVEILRQTSDPTNLTSEDIVRAVEIAEDLTPYAQRDPRVRHSSLLHKRGQHYHQILSQRKKSIQKI